MFHIRDIGRVACTIFMTVRTLGHYFVGTAIHRRAILIGIAPWIGRHSAALDVGTVPDFGPVLALHQRRKPFRRCRITSRVEIEKIQ